MNFIRPFYRWPMFAIWIIIGVILTLIFLRNTIPTHGFTSRLITGWLGVAAKIFGVRINTVGTPLREKTLFVANHLSWLDILVLGHLAPLHFLSKSEVRNMPLFGWLATRAGTLYIHRGNKESASEATVEIRDALNEGHNCLVFAEGTTTDGNIKRFHGRLLQSAIDAHAIIQPIAIFYTNKDSQTNTISLNPATLFIGDTTIGESAGLIVREAVIDVEVHFLEPIHCKDRTRDELASHAYDEVIEAIERIRR